MGLTPNCSSRRGKGATPEELGELTGRPIVVSYAPQLELLRRSTVAVTHAGLNTVLNAMATWLPLIALPITNEQPGIAAPVVWVGAGEAVVDRHVTSQALRAAVVPVQSDPSYRAAAERVRKSIQAGSVGPELIEQSFGLRA